MYGDVEPDVGRQYIVRVEVDYSSSPPFVRYSVSSDAGTTFAPLYADEGRTTRWFAGAKASAGVSSVEFGEGGDVASFSGVLANANVAAADGVGYDSLADAIAAATNSLELLTNVTWPADTPVGTVSLDRGEYELSGVTLDEGGKVVVQSGYSSIPGEGKVNISLDQVSRLGVATAGRSPSQIASALKANGANGIPLWESYVLGLDPGDPGSRPAAAIELNGDKVELGLVGVSVNDASGATVTYRVYAADNLEDIASAQPVGGDRSVESKAELSRGLSEDRKFYRLKVDVELD